MITGDLKSKVDKLWTTFWNNGISNPLSVIEQISYLLFIKRLDDLEQEKEGKAQRLKRDIENPTFTPSQQHIRWSQFKNLDDKRQPIADNDIPHLVQCWQGRDPAKDKDRKAKAFVVPREEIIANAYDLSINRYKETEYEEVTYDPPKVILKKLRDLEDEIRQDLDALEGMLA
jgi:hypothetical protein